MAEKLTSSTILSEEQLNHSFKVFAGPGAGKTHFLVENIKKIVSTNEIITKSRSRKLACITYTNAAVNEIKHRLENYSDYVETYTIHGFIIENIIKPFQEPLIEIIRSDFGIALSGSGTISSQIEGIGILHGIERESIYSYIRSYDNGKFKDDEIDYSKKIMGDVQVNNDAYIHALLTGLPYAPDLSRSQKIKEGHEIAIKQYLWDVVRKLTHDEVLYFGLRVLQRYPAALYALRVRFPFVFVDEFQDTSPLQTIIIKLIGEKSTRVGVVGDLAQSIYSFQGAKPTDFLNFCIQDGQDWIGTINNNRRSTQNIVNFCNYIRKSDPTVRQISVRQYSNEEERLLSEGKPIHFLMGDSQRVKTLVSSLVSEGGVVLTRSWAAAFNYIQNISSSQAKLLSKIYNSYYNTPIQIREEIVENNNVTWVRAFRFVFNLYSSYSVNSFIDMIKAIRLYSSFDLKKITPQIVFSFDKLAKQVFEAVSEHVKTVDILKRFNEILAQEEYLGISQVLNPNGCFEIPIFDEQDKSDLIEAVSSLEWDTSFRLFNEVFSENSKYMTVHQAKGLEWKTVIVSVVPTRGDRTKLSKMFSSPTILAENSEDEFTRIFYVACSRAIEDLYVHIASDCAQQEIEQALTAFISETQLDFKFEFID